MYGDEHETTPDDRQNSARELPFEPNTAPSDTMPSDADAELPVVQEGARTYIHVQPADDGIHAATVDTSFKRLSRFTLPAKESLLQRFGVTDVPRPTIEWLLRSSAHTTAVEYYVGIDDPLIGELENALRRILPTSYELERTKIHPAELGELVDYESADDTAGGSGGTTRDGGPAELAAVEYQGRQKRRKDWQTGLTDFSTWYYDHRTATHGATGTVPLASIVETMADASVPMVYQALIRPRPDWTAAADLRKVELEKASDTIGDQFINVIAGPVDDDYTPQASDQGRIEDLQARDTYHSFDVSARVVVGTPPDPVGFDVTPASSTRESPEAIARELKTALSSVGQSFYGIDGVVTTGQAARAVARAVGERTLDPVATRIRDRLPLVGRTRRPIVADAKEVANFCLVDGAALTANGRRAIASTPADRSSLARPQGDQLDTYRGSGLLLGHPLTQDDATDPEPLVLPPSLQSLHVGWFGKTGAGKSTSLINAILANHAATDGADILIDPKGDGMATDYLKAHRATYGSLDNVLYFDCAELLPAISFFDIRDELEAGVSRTTAVEDRVDHYVETLEQIMGRDRFQSAVRSPDVLKYVTKAMFDPVSGHDAFGHRDLHNTVRRMHERKAAPTVSDPDLERMLAGVVANRARSFDEIMQGVANRMEKIPVDRRLARMFNHVAEDGQPHFDLADYLDEDVVIVFDTGDLRTEAQRVLTLVILSNLWTALRRRATGDDADSHPLVNCYLEEAASVATSELFKQLLSQSRGFDCSMTLSMQFPAQLRAHGEDVYDEVMNNISTFVTGNVPEESRLARRLATGDMDPDAVGNRLRGLERGQWLVKLPAPFGEPVPEPFLVRSAAPPPGDPAGDVEWTRDDRRAFEEAMTSVRGRTRQVAGLAMGRPEPGTADAGGDSAEGEESADSRVRVDTALPHTRRMPPTVEYIAASHALGCKTCGNRYDPTDRGMERAIECCSSVAQTDRDNIPVCAVNLKLTPEERAASEWTDTQLVFLQMVYNAQQLRYEPPAYDLLTDSMIRLREYAGIEADAVQDLLDADLLRHDTDHPHRLYTVTHEGRSVIGESYRQGVDFGHGAGDLDESTQHVFAIEVARQYLMDAFVDDPDSPVAEVVPYYDIDEGRRLDVAGLDADGEIRVAVEAERINNDFHRAVPADYDKMADCEVDEAIWVVITRDDAHKLLAALNDPVEGEPRIDKTYSTSTAPRQFSLDMPGLTDIHTLGTLYRRAVEDD